MSESALDRLEARIRARAAAGEADKSYTASLLAKGPAACAQKLGEEAVETVIAALQNDPKGLVSESADLLYHWLVLLQARGVTMEQVFAELDRREGVSGLAEKASRGS